MLKRLDDFLWDVLPHKVYWRLRYRWGSIKKRLPMLPFAAVLAAGCFAQAKDIGNGRWWSIVAEECPVREPDLANATAHG